MQEVEGGGRSGSLGGVPGGGRGMGSMNLNNSTSEYTTMCRDSCNFYSSNTLPGPKGAML